MKSKMISGKYIGIMIIERVKLITVKFCIMQFIYLQFVVKKPFSESRKIIIF